MPGNKKNVSASLNGHVSASLNGRVSASLNGRVSASHHGHILASPVEHVKKVFTLLDNRLGKKEERMVIPFEEFLSKAIENPHLIFRNVFQLFSDMIYHYITEDDEYQNDPENINYKTINCDRLLVNDTDTPFFADLPLANRLLHLAEAFKAGSQQNKMYVFIGPHGSGKSTFLNNLLWRLQEYTHLPEGIMYETIWQFDEEMLAPVLSDVMKAALDEYYKKNKGNYHKGQKQLLKVPCPNHDHPILLIPREHRREILENMLSGEMRIKIFNKKEYEWVFQEDPCTICQSFFQALQDRLEFPSEVYKAVYARRYYFNRRFGNGISIFNPGDREPEKFVSSNEAIQHELDIHFRDSSLVKYVFSRFAKTNNGVFAIMDVKGYNEKRFLDLHGIISEGVHKIEDIEENVNSLFIAVMNPEDKEDIKMHESFKDRIKEINVNYNLNYHEEVKIYFHSFGSQIRNRFLPTVLDNFAKIIISSRLQLSSEALKNWIPEPGKYKKYCDDHLLLLKLSVYNNKIPRWLSQEDYNSFTKTLRRKLIAESETEGRTGFSGRESVAIFDEFYNSAKKKYAESEEGKTKVLITMDEVKEFFLKNRAYNDRVPKGFIDSIIRLYDYDIIQQIKESLFHENEERISKDIQNYLFAANYDMGEFITSPYTGEIIEVSDNFFNIVEQHLFRKTVKLSERKQRRDEIAYKFTTNLQEMDAGGSEIADTGVYKDLYELYMKNLRENIIQPFIKYAAFENAIKVFDTAKFEVFDTRTRDEVIFLIKNLMSKFGYSEDGARQVCLYALHNHIPEKFTD